MGIDEFNGSMGKRTAQNFALEESRERDVARVLRLSGHLFHPIEAAGWFAYSEKYFLHFLIPRMSRSLAASAGSSLAMLATTFSISPASSGSMLRFACFISARNCGSFMVSWKPWRIVLTISLGVDGGSAHGRRMALCS